MQPAQPSVARTLTLDGGVVGVLLEGILLGVGRAEDVEARDGDGGHGGDERQRGAQREVREVARLQAQQRGVGARDRRCVAISSTSHENSNVNACVRAAGTMLPLTCSEYMKGTHARSPKTSMNPNPSMMMSIVVRMHSSQKTLSATYSACRATTSHMA